MKTIYFMTIGAFLLIATGASLAQAQSCQARVPNFWLNELNNNTNYKTDITFAIFGDTQYGHKHGDSDKNKACEQDTNKIMVDVLNSLENKPPGNAGQPPGRIWPEQFSSTLKNLHGKKINRIRGVLIAGDLLEGNYHQTYQAQMNEFNENITKFEADFGLCGGDGNSDGSLIYPVYEGYGNHDYFWDQDIGYLDHPVIKSVIERNKRRVLERKHKKHGHYSWDWDMVRFINLNLSASNSTTAAHLIRDKQDEEKGIRRLNPLKALGFLKQQLEDVGTDKPVVIMMHYPFWSKSRMTVSERKDFFDAIKKHNVIAIMHGHTHKTEIRNWKDLKSTEDFGKTLDIPVLDVGSPFFAKFINDKVAKKGQDVEEDDKVEHRMSFTLVRITDAKLQAVNYTVKPTCGPNNANNTYEIDFKNTWSVNHEVDFKDARTAYKTAQE